LCLVPCTLSRSFKKQQLDVGYQSFPPSDR
jgi:hypothetical protein